MLHFVAARLTSSLHGAAKSFNATRWIRHRKRSCASTIEIRNLLNIKCNCSYSTSNLNGNLLNGAGLKDFSNKYNLEELEQNDKSQRLFFLDADESDINSLSLPMKRLTTGVNMLEPVDATYEDMSESLKAAEKILICLSAFCTEVQLSRVINRLTRFLGKPRLMRRSREFLWKDLATDIPKSAYPILKPLLEKFLTGKEFEMTDIEVPGFNATHGIYHNDQEIDKKAKVLVFYQAKALCEYKRKFPNTKNKINSVKNGIQLELRDNGYDDILTLFSTIFPPHQNFSKDKIDPNIDNLETVENLEENIVKAADLVDAIHSYLPLNQQRLLYHELMKFINCSSIQTLNHIEVVSDIMHKLQRDVVPQVVHQYLSGADQVDETLGDPSGEIFRRSYQRRTAVMRLLCEVRMRYGQIFITNIDSLDEIAKTQLKQPSNELYALGWNIIKLLEYKKYTTFKSCLIQYKMQQNIDIDSREKFLKTVQEIFGTNAVHLMDSFKLLYDDLTLEILAMCHIRMSSIKHGIRCYARNINEFEKLETGNNAQIYVAGLPYLTSKEQLVDAFRKVGKVVEVRIFNDDMCREDIALTKLKKRGRKPGCTNGKASVEENASTKKKIRKKKPMFEQPILPTIGAILTFSTSEEAKLALSNPLRLFGVALPEKKFLANRALEESQEANLGIKNSEEIHRVKNIKPDIERIGRKARCAMCYPQPLDQKQTITFSVSHGVVLSKVLEDIRQMVFPYADIEIHCDIPTETVLTDDKIKIMFDKHSTAFMIMNTVLSNREKYQDIKSIRWESQNLSKFRVAEKGLRK